MNNKIAGLIVITLCILSGLIAYDTYINYPTGTGQASSHETEEEKREHVFFIRIITPKDLLENKYKDVRY